MLEHNNSKFLSLKLDNPIYMELEMEGKGATLTVTTN